MKVAPRRKLAVYRPAASSASGCDRMRSDPWAKLATTKQRLPIGGTSHSRKQR
jgi:hypothetical protein